MSFRMSFATMAFLLSMLPFMGINLAYYGGFVEGAQPVPEADVRQSDVDPSAAEEAELDDDGELPGWFVPTQGRLHVNGTYPLVDRVEFCPPDQISERCYASNPPTSGLHYGVQNAVLPTGEEVRLPPDPGVYDWAVPREAIPHIQEHAGVYVGHNCATAACRFVVLRLEEVIQEQNTIGHRVVMSPDPDLAPDTIALASWTRVDTFIASQEYDEERVIRFIETHSCRFDPEGFCEQRGARAGPGVIDRRL